MRSRGLVLELIFLVVVVPKARIFFIIVVFGRDVFVRVQLVVVVVLFFILFIFFIVIEKKAVVLVFILVVVFIIEIKEITLIFIIDGSDGDASGINRRWHPLEFLRWAGAVGGQNGGSGHLRLPWERRFWGRLSSKSGEEA